MRKGTEVEWERERWWEGEGGNAVVESVDCTLYIVFTYRTYLDVPN